MIYFSRFHRADLVFGRVEWRKKIHIVDSYLLGISRLDYLLLLNVKFHTWDDSWVRIAAVNSVNG